MKKLVCFFGISLFLYANRIATETSDFKLGIENMPDRLLHQLKTYRRGGCRIGLITNQTGRDQKGNRTLDILLQKGLNVLCILAPEHGFEGAIQASENVPDMVDSKTHVPVLSLYKDGAGKQISASLIEKFDAIAVDIQDSGMRHYTYISTLYNAIESAANHRKLIIVFDRPNLLGGNMEGPLVQKKLKSFISIAPIPLRHGMTIGELALYFNKRFFKKKARVVVVNMENYNRTTFAVDHLQAPLSPNIATMQAAYGYSFLGLLGEIKPFDVGVGTEFAFQQIGVPKSLHVPESVWTELYGLLSAQGIKSAKVQYTRLKSGESYEGMRLYISDIHHLSSFSLFMSIVALFQRNRIPLNFSPVFDKAMGTAHVRSLFMDGKGVTSAIIESNVKKQLQKFYHVAKGSFLYEPHPFI